MQYTDPWIEESEQFSYDAERFDIAAESEWPEEQDLYRVMIDEDTAFDEKFYNAITFVEENQLWLLLEQSCSEGVWLPAEMRFERLKTCPKEMREKLDQLVTTCQAHVLYFVARIYWILVRMDRHDRTGEANWRRS